MNLYKTKIIYFFEAELRENNKKMINTLDFETFSSSELFIF